MAALLWTEPLRGTLRELGVAVRTPREILNNLALFIPALKPLPPSSGPHQGGRGMGARPVRACGVGI